MFRKNHWKRMVTKKRIKDITQLLLLLGFVALLAGIVALINPDAWSNPVFWIGLMALLFGSGFKFWQSVASAPLESLRQDIAASQGSEKGLFRGSDPPPSQ